MTEPTSPSSIVHLAGHRIQLGGGQFVMQRCSWCGRTLADAMPALLPEDHFVRYDGGNRTDLGSSIGAESPDDSCWFQDPEIRKARDAARSARDGVVWEKVGDHPAVKPFQQPAVDPLNGRFSALPTAVQLADLKHSETPLRFARQGCDFLMRDHGWIDGRGGGFGITVCPGDVIGEQDGYPVVRRPDPKEA